MAVKIALETLLDDYQEKHIAIHTDSQLVIGWLHKDWKVNTNRMLITETKRLLPRFLFVSFVKVKGHSGNVLNEKADKLAQEAALKIAVSTWPDQVV